MNKIAGELVKIAKELLSKPRYTTTTLGGGLDLWVYSDGTVSIAEIDAISPMVTLKPAQAQKLKKLL